MKGDMNEKWMNEQMKKRKDWKMKRKNERMNIVFKIEEKYEIEEIKWKQMIKWMNEWVKEGRSEKGK